MKLFRFIFLIFPIFANFIPIDVKPKTYGIKEITITPLFLQGDTKIYYSVTASKLNPCTFSIYISNDIYLEKVKIFSCDSIGTKSGVFVYSNEYTRQENTITLEYSTFDENEEYSVIVKPITKPRYIITDASLLIEKNKSLHFTPEKGFESVLITYTFNGFDSLYIPTFYHKLDFSDFNFKINDYGFALFDPEINLYIENYQSSYLNKPLLKIPLTISRELNNKVSLIPKEILYVNKETLEMSLEPHGGLYPTKHFYLPRNEYRTQDIYTFNLEFKNFGNECSQVIHTFKFKALMNNIGNCISSEYCVLKA